MRPLQRQASRFGLKSSNFLIFDTWTERVVLLSKEIDTVKNLSSTFLQKRPGSSWRDLAWPEPEEEEVWKEKTLNRRGKGGQRELIPAANGISKQRGDKVGSVAWGARQMWACGVDIFSDSILLLSCAALASAVFASMYLPPYLWTNRHTSSHQARHTRW